eukprot:TRINITY_DN20603_c0_g1_i1.p1 TRINITY_DN20603_c0_g1~~TRINITY_DN20603_c0_g1_i1.p1  ORF type:complete len:484 (-),score=44.46 TRINITY_DN20603_c0_g1_i1:73-1524(-)
MKEVAAITRSLVSGGSRLPCMLLAASVVAFALGAFTAPYLPSTLQGLDLGQGFFAANEQQKAIIENIDVPDGGSRATQVKPDEYLAVEVPPAGKHDTDGEAQAGLVIENVGGPPPEQESSFQESLSADASCDLFEGKWVPDPEGPLYSPESCSVLSGAQNCRANGRPDQGYEYWKWQPNNCMIPRFDPNVFLKVMQGKTLAFVGDSVARNHMDSLMCVLMQVEKPKNRGSKKMQRWFFASHSVTIIRIWSSWLVHTSFAAIDIAPEGLTKLHLEQVDENFDSFLPMINVLIVSAGHWFVKKSAFVIDDKVVGGQLWRPVTTGHNLTHDNSAAFAVAMRTALKRIISRSDYKGLTLLRTYSPDHYSGGEWNSGGSCTGVEAPLKAAQSPEFTARMRQYQIDAYNEVLRDGITNGSKLRLMDITPVFEYRPDGHPGPYRNQDPNKQTTMAPNGKPPPQDCLHWCMPGPIDTWNVFLFEILKQEFA